MYFAFMNEQFFRKVGEAYGWNKDACYAPLGNGLINHTWKVMYNNNSYVLQALNTTVFKQPQWIDENIQAITEFLTIHHPNYIFPKLLATTSGNTLIEFEGLWLRAFAFIEGTQTFTTVENTIQAFEAAHQFGKFTALLNHFNAASLHTVLPHFHNLALRYQQFTDALQNGKSKRINEATDAIAFLKSKQSIVTKWTTFIANKEAKQRVTHHDTKISNVLFDNNDTGICVIDLDTAMPGYFISDVGDMLRTYVCPVSEEAIDVNTIVVRTEFINAIQEGYYCEMKYALSAFEQDHFLFAGEYMLYMQAIRFLTDYLNNDIYYGCKYEQHNYNRALNQIVLLQRFEEAVNQ
jgi:Ser/Thr protein kinase RdoA (MazF antagonist)